MIHFQMTCSFATVIPKVFIPRMIKTKDMFTDFPIYLKDETLKLLT